MTEETISYLQTGPAYNNSKRLFDEISEVIKINLAGSEIMAEGLDTILETDSDLHVPVDKYIMTEIEVEGVSVVKNMTKRRYVLKDESNTLKRVDKDHEMPENSHLPRTPEANFPSSKSLVNELYEQENDVMTDVVQTTVQEFDVKENSDLPSTSQTNTSLTESVVSEIYEQDTNQVQGTVLESDVNENSKISESLCSQEDTSSDSMIKQENKEIPYGESHSALSEATDNLSSAKLSDKETSCTNGASESNLSHTSRDNDKNTSDLTSLCDSSPMQIPDMDVMFEKESEQALEGPLIKTTSTLEDSLAEDKQEEKNTASVVLGTEHVSSSIVNRKDKPLEIAHSPPKPIIVGPRSKKLLIIDINGLLADIVSPPPREYKADINIARRAIFKRPFYLEFLNFCLERFDVGIWSSRTEKNVERVTDYLLGDMKQKLLFCWDVSHCTPTGVKTLENKHKDLVCKELRRIWEKLDPNVPWEKGDYNESNTLLLDDSPYKALLNPPHSAIFPLSFKYHNRSDTSLGSGGDIRVYLEQLYLAENVQKYVEQHPFGQIAIDESDSSWDFYHKIISAPQLPLVMAPVIEATNEVIQIVAEDGIAATNEVIQIVAEDGIAATNQVNQNGGEDSEKVITV